MAVSIYDDLDTLERMEKELMLAIRKEEPLIDEAISKLDFDGSYNEQVFVSLSGVEVKIVVFRLFNTATGKWSPKSHIRIVIDHDGVVTERLPYGAAYYPEEGYDKELLIEKIKWTLASLKDQKYF